MYYTTTTCLFLFLFTGKVIGTMESINSNKATKKLNVIISIYKYPNRYSKNKE